MFTRCSAKSTSSGLIAIRAAAIATSAAQLLVSSARAQQVSSPVILQDFESTWQTITARTPDIFAAGYGSVYTPPPSRAQSGNQSVGYDVYDRFDLGSPGNPTLYGTANGYKTMINSIHAMGGSSYTDLVWNQSGFADSGTSGFAAAGGYPGFALTLQTTNPSGAGYNTIGINAVDGDYHSAYATGDQNMRLAGLIDIAQDSNNSFIRQPTVAGPNNIPGPTPGATGWNGFALANVPSATNAQFYPTSSAYNQTFTDPALGNQTFTRYTFDTSNPMSGTPVAENALGYLQRFAQYMVQVYGTDGFRVDAAKNMPSWVMNYLDLATYQSSYRFNLDGSRKNVFSFSEVYDSSGSLLTSYVNKSIYTQSANNVGGNRDVYDFPLFFAMQSNLTGTTANNNWHSVVSASIDCYDRSNGTQDLTPTGNTGVKFVSSQDNGAPSLDSVAYAYTLMMPGNAMVYYNGHNFGTGRNFPQNGREDAIGGVYGNALTTLVDLRNRYGRGNYREAWLEDHNYAFERTNSSLVMLSNDTTAGYDSRTIPVTFAAGTPLIELTGNAHSSTADPHGDIPQLLIVNADSSSATGKSVNVRFLRNSTYDLSNNSTYTGQGYLVYGLPTPQGSVSLTNVASTMGNSAPAFNNSNVAYLNGTSVVSTISVIKSATFQVQLNTVLVNLLGYYRDHPADGDNALIKVDGGLDVNGTGALFTNPNDAVTYGFEQFTTVHSPGYTANNGAGGAGQYAQTISSTQLGQGYHYITIEAFRHRDDGGPAVYTDWKQTVYIDLAPPDSAASSFNPIVAGTNENRNLQVVSNDGLANNIHTFLDLPFGLSSAQVMAQVGSGSQATQLDTTLWQHSYSGVTSGNHTVTVVSYKPDGTSNIQRYSSTQDPYLKTSTAFGSGIGDLNFDGSVNSTDINSFTTIVQSSNTQFNPAADVNGDGFVDLADTFLLGPVLTTRNVAAATWTSYNNFIFGSYVSTHTYTVSGTNVIYQDTAGITNVTAGGSLNATYVRGSILNIAAGGSVQIQSNPTAANGVSRIATLSIAGTTNAWTGKLDLTNNSLVLASTSTTSAADLARLTNMIRQGYDNGKWDGQGILSSQANSDTTHLHVLGIIVNNNGTSSAIYPTFYGQTADANSILVSYTYVGDANLSGRIDGSDYSRIDNGMLQHLSGWANGDFNYDGIVNGSDYTLIDNAFNQQGQAGAAPAASLNTQIAVPTAQVASNQSAVPEPTSLGLIGLTSSMLLARRRKGSPKLGSAGRNSR